MSSCDPLGAAFFQSDDLTVHYSTCFNGMDGFDCTNGSLAGGFVSNGACANSSCLPYVPYSVRTGFDESPKFLVPSTGPITKVCDAVNTSFCVDVNATPTPKNYSVPTVTVGMSYIVCNDTLSMMAFCKGKNNAYDSSAIIGTLQLMGSNNCASYNGTTWNPKTQSTYNYTIKCYMNDSLTTNGEASNLKIFLNSTLTYKCGNLDGVCPDTFSNTQICSNTTDGTSTDPDCGIHAYMKCLNVYDTLNHLEGNTCNYTKIPNASNPQCGIMSTITNITHLHAQCANGAVVQGLNGCPQCLQPGETITYGDGVTKYVGFTKVTENRTMEGQDMVSGIYTACPATKYTAQDKGVGVQCYPRPYKCDWGYRIVNSYGLVTYNGLTLKCDKPAWFNTTTNRWQLNMACIYNSTIVPGKLGTYCGLQSWYLGYEIYDDSSGIIVI